MILNIYHGNITFFSLRLCPHVKDSHNPSVSCIPAKPHGSRFSTSESVIVLITCSSYTCEEDTDVTVENWGGINGTTSKRLIRPIAEEDDVSSELLPDDSSPSCFP